ncbi:MAG: phosphoenolpyruvate--protein phosphotransferase [Bacteroidetes bacterium]|nr:phosphoenolpyruvate--protein phosphotransferase [Bacteroidota bacterium]MBI3483239.1 phosphoenolpyruvate--protein phosphotransferase [Bacteroidota bacterium]
MSGVAASPGIAIGSAYVVRKNEIISSGTKLKNESEVLNEIEKFKKAVQASVDDVEAVKNNEALKLNDDEVNVLEAHIELLTDPQLHEDVLQKINADKKNAVDAVIEVVDKFVEVFKSMSDEYMSASAADVKDIGNRILGSLNHSIDNGWQNFQSNTIIIAEDISPSEAITIDMTLVIAFATSVGGKTSHTAILAKSKNLPAVLGCGNTVDKIENGDVIIVDGTKGVVIVNPGEKCLEEYSAKMREYQQGNEFLRSLKSVSCQTSDGVKITLRANISSAEDMLESLKHGAEGAGLFRTELLFMNRNSFPSEEEQFQFYSKVALKSKGKPVIVRTIDIGGDKPLGYFNLPKEENPFLGYRAIRISLDRKDLFVTQLKAILRASAMRNFRIMFPMISSLQELRLARKILEEAKQELRKANLDFDENIPVGMMIEVPSAALMADIFAKEVDFFSIGTNDLCQYTLAVDRGNEKIKDLYDPYNPAVLRLISYTIEQANKYNISVGMCGELASDPMATRLLLGMGLTEFSMSATSIPSIKNLIVNNSYEEAREVCGKVMAMDNSKSIIDYLKRNA